MVYNCVDINHKRYTNRLSILQKSPELVWQAHCVLQKLFISAWLQIPQTMYPDINYWQNKTPGLNFNKQQIVHHNSISH